MQEASLEGPDQPRIYLTHPDLAISLKFSLMCLDPKKRTEVTTSIAQQRLQPECST